MLKIQGGGRADSTAKVTFALASEVIPGQVSVLGDFNGWDPLAHPLKKRSNGTYSVCVEIPAGTYRFKYLAEDGNWFCDPELDDVQLNEFQTADSVVRV